MASPSVQTPDSLTRELFIYVTLGAIAFLIGCVAMITLIPVTG
jgi:hypothetical protein